MTPLQHRRYLRFWCATFARHWCGVKGGEPIARPGRGPSALRDQVVAQAGAMAGAGRLTADHLRHACHAIALGRDVTSLRMTSKEQDLVIAVFQRLSEGEQELAGQIRSDARAAEVNRIADAVAEYESRDGTEAPWTARRPDADRTRVLWSLAHSGYPEPAIAAIARDEFGTDNWRGLDDARLYRLLLTVKRAAARKTAASEAGSVRGPAAPFPAEHYHPTDA